MAHIVDVDGEVLSFEEKNQGWTSEMVKLSRLVGDGKIWLIRLQWWNMFWLLTSSIGKVEGKVEWT